MLKVNAEVVNVHASLPTGNAIQMYVEIVGLGMLVILVFSSSVEKGKEIPVLCI